MGALVGLNFGSPPVSEWGRLPARCYVAPAKTAERWRRCRRPVRPSAPRAAEAGPGAAGIGGAAKTSYETAGTE